MYLDKVFVLFIFVLLFLTITIVTVQHEFAHKTFNDKFGLESEYFLDLPFYVGVKTYGEQPSELKIMHGINEAINYNLVPLGTAILILMGYGFWYLGSKIDYWFEKMDKEGITIQAIPPEKSKEVELDGVVTI